MRSIIEGPYFASCVEQLGGYRAVDEALEAIIDGLSNDPYGFPFIENDWCKIRYARTRAIQGYIPALIVAFTITSTAMSFSNGLKQSMKQKSQVSKFRETARALGADQSESAFNAALKKVATAPSPAKPKRKAKPR